LEQVSRQLQMQLQQQQLQLQTILELALLGVSRAAADVVDMVFSVAPPGAGALLGAAAASSFVDVSLAYHLLAHITRQLAL